MLIIKPSFRFSKNNTFNVVYAGTYQQAVLFQPCIFASTGLYPCLRSSITTYINNCWRFYLQEFHHKFFMHASTGGSVMITSGLPCSAKSIITDLYHISAKKDACSMLFRAAFFFASSMASSITSTPITFLASLLTKCRYCRCRSKDHIRFHYP